MSPTERITQMEQRLVRATQHLAAIEEAYAHWHELQTDIETLNTYLGSAEWHADRTADAANQLPSDLPRGVLSEDAIWNLLERWKQLTDTLHENRRD